MLRLRRIVGHSMEPTLREGKIVIAYKARQYKVGDIVFARIKNDEVIKRIALIDDLVILNGDNVSDSTNYQVRLRDIFAKVINH